MDAGHATPQSGSRLRSSLLMSCFDSAASERKVNSWARDLTWTGVEEQVFLNGSNWECLFVCTWPDEECESFRSVFEFCILTLNTDRSAASTMSSRVRFTNSPHCRKP